MVAPLKVDGRRPLGIDEVTLAPDSYLGHTQDLNASATLPHILGQLEESRVLVNLREQGGDHEGFVFADSDLYKTLEAIGWEIARTGTTAFDGFLSGSYALLGSAQQSDGYLNSWGMSTKSPGQWVDLQWGHELYCAGHLIQAAVALNRAGRPELLVIARRLADLIVARFADDGVCGHAEIETAMVELYRETGDRAYLDSAAGFVGRRGNPTTHTVPFGPEYFQDHEPPRTATMATGHAVRQLYLDAGCVDVAVETGDAELLAAVERRWESAHHRRMFVTGGMGSHFQDESFGDDHELASERSYAETCAAIADFHLSWRLLLATGDARYGAAMERTLYNAIPAAVSEDGTRFTYANPLQVRAGARTQEYSDGRRPWFSCACCPPNVARLRASLASYLAVVTGEGIDLVLPSAGEFRIPDELGHGVVVIDGDIEEGALRIRVDGEVKRLRLRAPSWAREILVNGQPAEVLEGWVTLPVEAEVSFDVSPTLLVADPRVDAVRGAVAVQAGPTVLCAEGHDNVDVDALGIDVTRPVTGGPAGAMASGGVLETDDAVLYRPLGADPAWRLVPITLIPYRHWCRRGRSPMRVWLPRLP